MCIAHGFVFRNRGQLDIIPDVDGQIPEEGGGRAAKCVLVAPTLSGGLSTICILNASYFLLQPQVLRQVAYDTQDTGRCHVSGSLSSKTRYPAFHMARRRPFPSRCRPLSLFASSFELGHTGAAVTFPGQDLFVELTNRPASASTAAPAGGNVWWSILTVEGHCARSFG